MPLHKGADGFMSQEQFGTFYWSSLRAVIMGLIDEGFVPLLFGEGKMDSRLERIAADLPKGKTVWILDRTDMTHAKATIGKVSAIQGNVPLSILQTGTPEQVTEYCRRLIEVAAPGGGFILDSGAVLHEGNQENIRAMIQAAHDYGTY
jgi:uroporphyrinogen-III decarboxylase